MKPILLITSLLFALCSAQLRADHITVEGSVSGEWNADTVMVTGDITVPNGQSLLIQPGTVVEFMGSYKFTVDGAVDAQGLPGQNIVFEPADTTGFAVDSIPEGGWQGIRFDHVRLTNDPSVFAYCNFSYGKMVSADPATGHGGAIYIKAYNQVTIDECTFHNNFATYNGGAVYLDSADIIIHGSTFTGNRCGLAVAPWGYGGAICSDNSNPDIRWNVFEDNYSTGVGGALAVRFEDCNVYSNIFANNASALGGAFGFLHIPACVNRINNNLIVENEAAFFGGGVANLNASPVYINNTIAYNSSVYGGGFYCKDSVSPDFYNTILWGNTANVGPQGYLFEVYSQADFFNCDVEGGPAQFGGSGGGEAFFGAFEQCLDMVPEYIGSGDYPYALSDNSPLIDMGSSDTSGFFLPETDLAGNPRWYGASPDMGSYEWNWVGIMDSPVADSPVKIWPNPFRENFWIELGSNSEENLLVEVFDMTGRRLYAERFSGNEKRHLVSDFYHFPGIYLLKISSENSITVERLIKSSL